MSSLQIGEKMSRNKDKVGIVADEKIVIDKAAGLSFANETELYDHFANAIQSIEQDYLSHRSESDLSDKEQMEFDQLLPELLDDPDEIWEDSKTLKDDYVWIYIKALEKDPSMFHVALCYLTEDVPSFVYLHFVTRDAKLLAHFKRQNKVYDREDFEAPMGAIDGDALNEGDELALGLYKAMMLLRSDDDILEERFVEYHEYREEGIEDADEIWRSNDSFGNTLVSFVKEFTEDGKPFWYVVVTLEDSASNSHALLFSFPTRDQSLVDRYRHGENLQAEEVVQESSH